MTEGHNENGKFAEGNAGKPKGATNKVTRQIKDVINKLLDCSTDEDIRDIYQRVKKDSPAVMLNFWGKIAPKDLTIQGEVKVDSIDLSKLSQEEINKLEEVKKIINEKGIINNGDDSSTT